MATRSLSFHPLLIVPHALISAPKRFWSYLRLLQESYRDALAMAEAAQRRGIFVE